MKIDSLYNIFLFTIISVTLIVDKVFTIFPEFRYLKYIGIPFFLILVITNYKNFKFYGINDRVKPYLLLITVSIILYPLLTKQGIFELIFIFAGISMFIFLPDIKININALNYFSIFLFILLYLGGGSYDFSLEAFYKSNTSSTEGGYSFIFGFFAIYYWEQRKFSKFLINLLFIVLSLKRIVFLGVIVVIILSVLPKKISNILTHKILLIGANLSFILITQMLTAGSFDENIRKHTGIGTGEFTSGRTFLYSLVLDKDVFSGRNMFLGIGQGGTSNILEKHFEHNFLLHNDILKIVVEHGYLIFIVFFWLLYETKDEKILRLTIFLNLLYLTDNALIYQVVYLMYFVLSYLYIKESESDYCEQTEPTFRVRDSNPI